MALQVPRIILQMAHRVGPRWEMQQHKNYQKQKPPQMRRFEFSGRGESEYIRTSTAQFE